MERKLIEILECRKAHGIRGGAHCYFFNPDSPLLNYSKSELSRLVFFLKKHSDNSVREISLTHLKLSRAPQGLLQIEGIGSRDELEELLPFTVFLPREALESQLGEDEFFFSDLEGQEVREHKTQKSLGVIEFIDDRLPTPVVRIRGKEGVIELPLHENFFPVFRPDCHRYEAFLPEYV